MVSKDEKLIADVKNSKAGGEKRMEKRKQKKVPFHGRETRQIRMRRDIAVIANRSFGLYNTVVSPPCV